MGVDVMLGMECIEVDASVKRVVLRSGAQIGYDKVLIATGCTAAIPEGLPGMDLPGVFTLRSLQDSQNLVAHARSKRRAVIIGSGFIGIELSSTLRTQLSFDEVTVVGKDAVPFQRVFGKEIGELVMQLGREKGISFKMEVCARPCKEVCFTCIWNLFSVCS